MSSRASRLAVFMVLVIGAPAFGIAQPTVDGLAPYRAVYAVLNDGKRVGEAIHTLSYDPRSRHYVFETHTVFRGLLRLASPRPLVERSEFVVLNGNIRPLAFTYEDGSRSGRNNVEVTFDWAAERLVASTGESRQTNQLPAGSYDRASARLALMRDVAAGVATATHRIADPDEVRLYALRREDRELRTTALGELQTIRVVQQRPGSTRRIVTWLAPDLRFLAVRIEQQRDDRGPIAFEIESVDWNDAPRTR